MNTYSIVLSLHVITAILGLGPLAAVTVLTAPGLSLPLLPLQRIMRLVIWSLLVMLVTGGVLAGLVRGAFEHAWWLRISVILFFFLGFLHGRVRRTLRAVGSTPDSELMRRINRILWVMCLCVAAIAYLMQAKPW
jgi:hypothetical protein